MSRYLLNLATSLVSLSLAAILEVSNTLPSSLTPYVVRHLDGPKVLLADDVFRFLTNENTTGIGQVNETANGFSMLLSNGKPNDAVPPHYTFIPIPGQMTVWADGVPKNLGAGDFAMVPAYHNHNQFIAQETEFLGLVQPAGFDDFFSNVSVPWPPSYNVPFPPDQPLPFPGMKFQSAVKAYDINQMSANCSEPTNQHGWHKSNVTLPNDSKTTYFLPNSADPHYWNEGAGTVMSPLATSIQTDGNFTIAQISLRKTRSHANATWASTNHQFLYGMVGEVTVSLDGENVRFIAGDSVFIPAGKKVAISSSVNYSKFLLCAAGVDGMDTQMIKAGKPWQHSMPPAH